MFAQTELTELRYHIDKTVVLTTTILEQKVLSGLLMFNNIPRGIYKIEANRITYSKPTLKA